LSTLYNESRTVLIAPKEKSAATTPHNGVTQMPASGWVSRPEGADVRLLHHRDTQGFGGKTIKARRKPQIAETD
jgi:hypothetical protein